MSAQAAAARNLINVGRHGDAVTFLGHALASTPDDYELHALLAQAYLGLNQPAAALRAAEEASRRAPEDEWVHRVRSLVLRRSGRARDAVAASRESVRLAPELAIAHHSLAEAHLAARQHDDAYVQALEALRLSPESADLHDLVGRCLIRKRMYREAESAFRRALTLDPNHAAAHNNLGVVLAGTGRRAQAVHEYNEAARLDPSFEVARKNLYSATRFMLGGGSVVFFLYLLVRLSVAINVGRNSPGILFIGVGVVVVGLLIWFLRYRPFKRKDLPATAIAYYRSESARLRRAGRPVLWLRLASFVVLGILVTVALVVNAPLLLLVAVPVTALWYWLAPRLWRRYAQRTGV